MYRPLRRIGIGFARVVDWSTLAKSTCRYTLGFEELLEYAFVPVSHILLRRENRRDYQ